MGFALRLVVLKRLAVERGTWWGVRGAIFYRLLTTRVFGLILLSMFFTEGWGQFDDWSDIAGFQDWLTQLVQNVQPYHTLTHIAFLTVWTFIAMTIGWRARCAQLVATTAIHITLHATFYFQWIKTYGLDEGGCVAGPSAAVAARPVRGHPFAPPCVGQACGLRGTLFFVTREQSISAPAPPLFPPLFLAHLLATSSFSPQLLCILWLGD